VYSTLAYTVKKTAEYRVGQYLIKKKRRLVTHLSDNPINYGLPAIRARSARVRLLVLVRDPPEIEARHVATHLCIVGRAAVTEHK